MTHQEVKALANGRAIPPWIMKLVSDVVAIEVQREREACIHVCKEIYSAWVCESDDDVDYPDPNDCIRAIRARGESK